MATETNFSEVSTTISDLFEAVRKLTVKIDELSFNLLDLSSDINGYKIKRVEEIEGKDLQLAAYELSKLYARVLNAGQSGLQLQQPSELNAILGKCFKLGTRLTIFHDALENSKDIVKQGLPEAITFYEDISSTYFEQLFEDARNVIKKAYNVAHQFSFDPNDNAKMTEARKGFETNFDKLHTLVAALVAKTKVLQINPAAGQLPNSENNATATITTTASSSPDLHAVSTHVQPPSPIELPLSSPVSIATAGRSAPLDVASITLELNKLNEESIDIFRKRAFLALTAETITYKKINEFIKTAILPLIVRLQACYVALNEGDNPDPAVLKQAYTLTMRLEQIVGSCNIAIKVIKERLQDEVLSVTRLATLPDCKKGFESSFQMITRIPMTVALFESMGGLLQMELDAKKNDLLSAGSKKIDSLHREVVIQTTDSAYTTSSPTPEEKKQKRRVIIYSDLAHVQSPEFQRLRGQGTPSATKAVSSTSTINRRSFADQESRESVSGLLNSGVFGESVSKFPAPTSPSSAPGSASRVDKTTSVLLPNPPSIPPPKPQPRDSKPLATNPAGPLSRRQTMSSLPLPSAGSATKAVSSTSTATPENRRSFAVQESGESASGLLNSGVFGESVRKFPAPTSPSSAPSSASRVGMFPPGTAASARGQISLTEPEKNANPKQVTPKK
jgi:hypothetical protein